MEVESKTIETTKQLFEASVSMFLLSIKMREWINYFEIGNDFSEEKMKEVSKKIDVKVLEVENKIRGE